MILFQIDEHISLKLIELKHAEKIFELINKSRTHLRQWESWVDSTVSVKDTRNYIQYCLYSYTSCKSIDFVIFFNDEIVGLTSLHQINNNLKKAEVGYWIGTDYQGRGIVTKAVKGLITYAFNELELKKIEIRTASDNLNSQRVPERLNFKKEGKLPRAQWLYDRYLDHNIYGISAEEWSKFTIN